MLTMEEILNIVPAWTKITKDTQIVTGPVWIDAIMVDGKRDDPDSLYDSVGKTGPSILNRCMFNNVTEYHVLGVKFNDGLYVDLHTSTTSMIIFYRPLPE